MKIGILTLPLHSNYGGILQAYALQKYLKDRGHETILLNRQFNKAWSPLIRKFIKKTIYRNRVKEKKTINQNINNFIDSYISPITEEFHSTREFKKQVSDLELEILVVGSDQVWRYKYIRNMIQDYFLNFKNIKKLSYAASFGKDTWEGDEHSIKKIKPLIKDFDGISIREESGVELCEKLFGVKAKQHIDPVALLDLSHYKALIKKESEPDRNEELLVYMLDIGQDKQKVIDRIQKSVGGNTFSINIPQVSKDASLEEKIYPTVTNWLKGFFDAKFVITDSFHGTIFSLMHNKPFIVYGNKKRGLTRFYSILENVNLSHRIISSSEDLTEEILNEDIEWKNVNEFFNKEKRRTDEYFREMGL